MGSNILLWMVVQQLAAILEFSQEEMSAGSSTLPSCYLRIPSSPNSFLALTNSSLDRTAILGVLHVTLLHIKGNLCSFVHSFIHSFVHTFTEYSSYHVPYAVPGVGAVARKCTVPAFVVIHTNS